MKFPLSGKLSGFARKFLAPFRRHTKSGESADFCGIILDDVTIQMQPPVFVDVGAAGGFSEPWGRLVSSGKVLGVAFEPDPEAAAKLKTAQESIKILPFALGSEKCVRKLNITRFRECSSFLKPEMAVILDYGLQHLFEVVDTLPVDVDSYGSMAANGVVPLPEFIKIDVQGFESEVLKGFESCSDSIIAIEIEARFRPIYEGEWLVHDILNWMTERGLHLRRLDPQGPFRGEIVEANLFFSRRSSELTPRGALLLQLWEHIYLIPPVPETQWLPPVD
jgi:FkbM family methyltransferase